jgi:hypothetical protein
MAGAVPEDSEPREQIAREPVERRAADVVDVHVPRCSAAHAGQTHGMLFDDLAQLVEVAVAAARPGIPEPVAADVLAQLTVAVDAPRLLIPADGDRKIETSEL